MPNILPIKELRNTNELSELAHKSNEPIFITKNGYSDLVVMSAELYDQIMNFHQIDMSIQEAEDEMKNGGKTIDLDEAIKNLNKKYYGKV